jgi:hypothetical protein
MEDNPPICDTSAKQYCGGSYRGLLNKLDYIQSMGFDAVWISPVVENIEGFAAPNGAGYHGYWAKNITNLNPHFGTKDDLLLLSQELHKRSMYLMVRPTHASISYNRRLVCRSMLLRITLPALDYPTLPPLRMILVRSMRRSISIPSVLLETTTIKQTASNAG